MITYSFHFIVLSDPTRLSNSVNETKSVCLNTIIAAQKQHGKQREAGAWAQPPGDGGGEHCGDAALRLHKSRSIALGLVRLPTTLDYTRNVQVLNTSSIANDAGLLGRREMFDRVDKGIIEESAAIEESSSNNQMSGQGAKRREPRHLAAGVATGGGPSAG